MDHGWAHCPVVGVGMTTDRYPAWSSLHRPDLWRPGLSRGHRLRRHRHIQLRRRGRAVRCQKLFMPPGQEDLDDLGLKGDSPSEGMPSYVLWSRRSPRSASCRRICLWAPRYGRGTPRTITTRGRTASTEIRCWLATHHAACGCGELIWAADEFSDHADQPCPWHVCAAERTGQ
jgi:hypothetical protein